ncbi:MAG TPA: hypothetical protein PLI45_02900 [Candidatus Woesebacteria bacterium]|nr:hypothetical protein [Candidatus Woesebacteria bacterium]
MTTREEAEKLDPDVIFWVDGKTIIPDDDIPKALEINSQLRKTDSRKRARAIFSQDAVVATGLWTPEEAGDVADRMIFGLGGEYVDPKENIFRRLLRRLGFPQY